MLALRLERAVAGGGMGDRKSGTFFVKILGIGLSCLLSACQAPEAVTNVTLPGRSDAAVRIRRVAVLPFNGSDGQDASVKIESLLTEVKDADGKPFFTVVDRRTLQKALDELKFQQSGLVDDNRLAKLGHFVGADGIYSGTADAIAVKRTYHQEDRTSCNTVTTASGKSQTVCNGTYKVNCTDKVGGYSLVPRLVEIATARVVYSPTIAKARTSSFCSDSGAETSDGELVGGALADALEQVKADVGPHQVTLRLRYKDSTDGMPPPVRKSFEDSVAFAKGGRMDRACPIWRELDGANQGNLTLDFDTALCLELDGKYRDALAAYQVVDAHLTRPDEDVSTALKRVKQQAEDQAKLEAQTQAPAAPVVTPPTPKKVPKKKAPTTGAATTNPPPKQ